MHRPTRRERLATHGGTSYRELLREVAWGTGEGDSKHESIEIHGSYCLIDVPGAAAVSLPREGFQLLTKMLLELWMAEDWCLHTTSLAFPMPSS